MKDVISSGFLESFSGSIHGLSGGGEGACSQRLNVLRVADFGASVDNFLASFKEFLGKLAKLEDFPFDEWVVQSSYGMVDELLVRLPVLEYALSKRGEW